MSKDERLDLSRREVLISATMLGAGAVLGNAPALAGDAPAWTSDGSQTASGLVFERVGGERRGVSGVLVSNGREVAVTRADGRYTLPITDETIVFVIKPAGFMTPVDPVTMLPRFFTIHQPAGSPASLGLGHRLISSQPDA